MSEEPVGGAEAEALAAEAKRARRKQETGQSQQAQQVQVFDPKEIFPDENELSSSQRRRLKSLEPELQELWRQMNEQARQSYRENGNTVAALQALPAQLEFAELNNFILKGKPLSARVKQLSSVGSIAGVAAGAVGAQITRGVSRARQERAAAFQQFGETEAEKARVQRGQEGFSTVTYQGRGPTTPKTPSGSFGGESPFGAQVEHERHECCRFGTIILGDNKPIEQFNAGDRVLGQDGLQNVDYQHGFKFEGNLIKLSGNGLLPLEVTPNHPVLVREATSHQHRKPEYELSEPIWRRADELISWRARHNGHFMIIPRYQGIYDTKVLSLAKYQPTSGKWKYRHLEQIILDENSAWIMGLYVAEGSHSNGTVRFSLNAKETNYVSRIQSFASFIGITCVVKSQTKNGISVELYSTILGRAFEDWFGRGALNKKIPDWILLHKDLKIVKAFWNGYECGDGSFKDPTRVRCVTTSKILALQLQLLGARLGIFYRISIRTDPRKASYHICYNLTRPWEGKSNRLCIITETEILVPVKQIELVPYNGMVYSVVSPSHTFLVSNVITHNSVFDQEHGLVGTITGDVDADKLPEDFVHGNDIHQEPPREDRGDSWNLNDNFDFWTGTYKDGSRKPHQKGYNVISGTSNDQVVINGERPKPVGDEVLGGYNGPESPEKEKSILDSLEPNPDIEGSVEKWEVNDDYDILTGTHKNRKRKPAPSAPAVVANEEGELVPTVKGEYSLAKGSSAEQVKDALQKIEEEETGTAKEMHEPKSDATGGYTPDLQELREAVGGRTELKFFRIIGRERGNGPHAGEGKYLVTTVPVDPKFMKIEWRPYGSQSAVKKARKFVSPQAPTATENALKRAAQTTAAPTNEEVLDGSNTLGGERATESSVFDDSEAIKEKQSKSGTFLSGIL